MKTDGMWILFGLSAAIGSEKINKKKLCPCKTDILINTLTALNYVYDAVGILL